LIQLKNLKFGYDFEAGLAYNTDTYDLETNSNKIFSSVPVMVYIGFGVDLEYRLSNQLEIGVGINAKHYSNGRIGIMNKGLNLTGKEISLRYYLSPQPLKYPKVKAPQLQKRLEYHILVGGGIQTYLEDLLISHTEDHYRLYSKYFASTDVLYRFVPKYACGIGLDLFYVPSTASFRKCDEKYHPEEAAHLKYNPFSMGIAFNQELNYKNLSLAASIGYYLYRELGLRDDEGVCYQRAGFRYYFPDLQDVFLGATIKAHQFRKAEYFELSVGKRL
jgi:hypothetical protein